MSAELPPEYNETYQRAYRRSLAEHPTELMSPARPGKRADEKAAESRLVKLEHLIADILLDPRKRIYAAVAGVVALLLLAYGAGRLLA